MKYGPVKNLFLLFGCLFASAAYADVTVKRGELVCAYRYDVEKKKLVWENVDHLPMRAFGPIILIDKPKRGIKFFKKGKFKIKIEGQVKDCIPKIAGFEEGKIEKVIINNETVKLYANGKFRKEVELHEGDNYVVVLAENALGHKWNAVVYVKLEKLGEFSKIYKGAIAVRPGYSQDPSMFFVFLRAVGAQGDELKGEMYMSLNVDEFKEKYAAIYKENEISEDEEEKIKGRWIRTVFHRKPGTNDFAAGPYLMSTIPLYRPEVAEGLSIEVPIMVGRPGEDIYFKPDDGNPVRLGSLSFASLIIPRHVAKLAAATGKDPSYKATLIYSDDVKEDTIKLFLPAAAAKSNKDIDLTDKFKKEKDNVMTATIGPDKTSSLFGSFGAATCDLKEKKPVNLIGDYALPAKLKFNSRTVSQYFVISELISDAKAYNEINENIQKNLKMKDWKAAARLSNKGMKDFKNYREYFSYMLAVSYYGMKDHKNAIRYFNAVLKKYPTNQGALLYKAWCYFQLKQAKETIAMAKRMMLFAGKDDPGANWILACVYCSLKKNYKRAKMHCELTLKGAPNHGPAKKLLKDLNRVVK